MDILDRLLDAVQKKLGPEVFTQELAESIERQFRHDYGAEAHYVASLRAFEVEKRNAEIKRLKKLGVSCSDIAARFGVSKKHVWKVSGNVS